MKTYELNLWNNTYKVVLNGMHYVHGNRLAIQMDLEDGEPFATITVNLPDDEVTSFNANFVDINNCPWAVEFLIRNNIAEPTGNIAFSGFCVYPEFEFDLSKINMLD